MSEQKLSKQERAELLADANSQSRRRDFVRLKVNQVVLAPHEYIEFLDWASVYSTEKHEDRDLITGSTFLL